jgi:hypothetical protein
VISWSLNKEQGMCLKAGMKTPFAFHQLTNLSSIQMSTLAEIHHLVPSDAHLPGKLKSLIGHRIYDHCWVWCMIYSSNSVIVLCTSLNWMLDLQDLISLNFVQDSCSPFPCHWA